MKKTQKRNDISIFSIIYSWRSRLLYLLVLVLLLLLFNYDMSYRFSRWLMYCTLDSLVVWYTSSTILLYNIFHIYDFFTSFLTMFHTVHKYLVTKRTQTATLAWSTKDLKYCWEGTLTRASYSLLILRKIKGRICFCKSKEKMRNFLFYFFNKQTSLVCGVHASIRNSFSFSVHSIHGHLSSLLQFKKEKKEREREFLIAWFSCWLPIVFGVVSVVVSSSLF